MSADAPTVPTVSVRQAAAFLGIGVVSVRREVDAGAILGWRDGRRYRIDRAELLERAGYPADFDLEK